MRGEDGLSSFTGRRVTLNVKRGKKKYASFCDKYAKLIRDNWRAKDQRGTRKYDRASKKTRVR